MTSTLLRGVFFTLLVAGIAAFGCGGGGGGGGDSSSGMPGSGLNAAFAPSGTPRSADLVRLLGVAEDSNTVRIDVVIGGVTTSNDIYGFAFDLVLSNPDVAEYIPNSADFGSALDLGSGQGSLVEASQQGDRVVVGVSKSGGGPGNGIGDEEPIIVSLYFEVQEAGTTDVDFAGSPTNPMQPSADPVAFDSSENVIPSIDFDAGSASISG
jgi:hypothetical protein